MTCYNPITVYWNGKLTVNGKKDYVYSPTKGFTDITAKRECRTCIGCRYKRQREWATRAYCESQLYENNVFITLTYAPENLPENGSLVKRDYELFMKRLRKRFSGIELCTNPNNGKTSYDLRSFMCGEYGEKTARPHYHAILYNFDFPDKYYWRKADSGHRIFRSDILEELWPHGNSEIGSVTYQAAAYIAGYIFKKQIGKNADEYYARYTEYGELVFLTPEYFESPRKYGLGSAWLQKYADETYAYDYLIINGKKTKPPKFFDTKYEIENPERFAKISLTRRKLAKKLDTDDFNRLQTKHLCKLHAHARSSEYKQI